jgi:hypothetical protein
MKRPQESVAVPGGDDLAPQNVIRTETVLSKLPIHNLAKKGRVDIRITRKAVTGEIDLKWEVSHSDLYGQPRQLAYKVDTLVINRRIDEAGRPLPKWIRLGSLSQICKELGVPASGKNTNDLKRAIHQNAGAYITAKMQYRGRDGSERRLEAGFTRYGVVFTGERLPDGTRADSVYILPNDPYRDVLNSAPFRPLNYDYLRELRPGAQRFYEVLSYRMFAALKHDRSIVRLSYADYCMFSAQQRYVSHERFRVQMYKIHKPHLESGYLGSVAYQAATDPEGESDWIMNYTPGPKARAEFQAFRWKEPSAVVAPELGEPQGGEVDESLLQALQARGVSASHAKRLLAQLPEGQSVMEQLEWGDYVIGQSRPGTFKNPPGFYVSVIRDNLTPPDTFESTHQRQVRQETEESSRHQAAEQRALREAYEKYRSVEVNRYMTEELSAEVLARAIEGKKQEFSQEFPLFQPDALERVAKQAVAADLAKQITTMSFSAFRKTRPLKP